MENPDWRRIVRRHKFFIMASVPTTVLIVEDNPEFATALRKMLKVEPTLQVLGEVACGEDGVLYAAQLKPDVVIIDANLPGGWDGMETTRRITRGFSTNGSRPKVIGLSANPEEFEQLMRNAGACHFLSKLHASRIVPLIRTMQQR